MGRATQGVRVIRLDEGDDIADITIVPAAEDEDVIDPDGAEGDDSEANAEDQNESGD